MDDERNRLAVLAICWLWELAEAVDVALAASVQLISAIDHDISSVPLRARVDASLVSIAHTHHPRVSTDTRSSTFTLVSSLKTDNQKPYIAEKTIWPKSREKLRAATGTKKKFIENERVIY